MLAEKLEIFIITYNRAALLERTLSQLQNSPPAGCKITVLDNCSPDETAAVCAKYQPLFEDFHIVRHPKNIGACANYLRAVEMSRAPYTWVICDDDVFDWSQSDDVWQALETEKFGLISVGSPNQYAWERGLATTVKDLVKRGARYFGAFTFMPGVIFKASLFDSKTLAQCYRNIPNEWVHFPYFYKCYQEDVPVYLSQHEIVVRDGGSSLPSQLHAFAAYVTNCRIIEDPALRRRVIYQCAPSRRAWFLGLAPAIAGQKVRDSKELPRKIADLALGLSGDQKVLLALMAPLLITPAPVYKMALKAWRKRKGAQAEENKEFDSLRL